MDRRIETTEIFFSEVASTVFGKGQTQSTSLGGYGGHHGGINCVGQ